MTDEAFGSEGEAFDGEIIEVGQDMVLLFRGDPPDDATVGAMVERLIADPHLDAVGASDPVIDAIKVVDADARVTTTLDRSRLVTLGMPAVVRRTAWRRRQIGSFALI